MGTIVEQTIEGLMDKLADERARSAMRAGLLREARDWIARELQATEAELPDAEDLCIRIGKALPHTVPKS